MARIHIIELDREAVPKIQLRWCTRRKKYELNKKKKPMGRPRKKDRFV